MTMIHEVAQGLTLLHPPPHGHALVPSVLASSPPAQLPVVSLAQRAHSLGPLPRGKLISTHLLVSYPPPPRSLLKCHLLNGAQPACLFNSCNSPPSPSWHSQSPWLSFFFFCKAYHLIPHLTLHELFLMLLLRIPPLKNIGRSWDLLCEDVSHEHRTVVSTQGVLGSVCP